MSRSLFLSMLLLSCFSAEAQWTQRTSNTANTLYDVQFPEGNTGFAVGYYGTVIRSVDAGLSWTLLSFPNTGDLRSVYFHDAMHGFVAGDSGLFRTADGGASWSTVATPAPGPWRCLTFVSPLIGFCGGGGFGAGTLLRTLDGGTSWSVVISGGEKPITAISFPDPGVGYAAVFGYSWEVLKSTDGGLNWSTIPIQPINNLSNLEGLHFVDTNTGYAGGWYIASFIRTTDGGASWSEVTPQFDMWDLAFASPTQGIAVGWNGAIHHTTNGTDWTDESWSDNLGLNAVDFASDSVAVTVGDNGLVLRWTDGTTGVRPVPDIAPSITVGPNPASGFIELHSATPLPNSARLELLDAAGRVVLSAPLQGQGPIDLAGVQPGQYAWRCVSADRRVAHGALVIAR